MVIFYKLFFLLNFYTLFSYLIFCKPLSFLTMMVVSCSSPILSTPLSHSKVRYEIKKDFFNLRSLAPHLKERALAMEVRPMLVTQAVTTLCTLHL